MELCIAPQFQTLSHSGAYMRLHSTDAERLVLVNGESFVFYEKKSCLGNESSKKRAVGRFQMEVSTSGDVGPSEICSKTPLPFTLQQDADSIIMNDAPLELPLIEDFIESLQMCKLNKHLADANSMYSHICSYGLESGNDVRNHILLMFLECGSISTAQRIFNVMSFRSEFSWTLLITGYIQSGRPQFALELYPAMLEDSVHASSFTLIALLKACASLKDLSHGQQIHMQIIHKGLEQCLRICSTLISMYASCRCIEEAEMVFHTLPSRDLVTWTALLSGYVDHGLGEKAIIGFEQMQQEDITPNAFTISCILKACGNVGNLEKGRHIHKEISQHEIRRDIFVGYSLVGMYAKCGALVEARQVFDELPVKGLVPWNSLIGGYANNGCWHEVLDCYNLMQLQGISPDAITFSSVLKACGSSGSVGKGRDVHRECMLIGCEDFPLVGNSLVSMYAKCGSLVEAEMVFKKLTCKDAISWTILISGYTEHASLNEAVSLFYQMQEAGILPRASTFASMLKACGIAECFDVGMGIHMLILKMGLEANVLIGNSLVGMYGKSGLIEEAHAMFDKLTVCDALSWASLIAAYSDCGLGKEAIHYFKLMRLEGILPDHATFACVFQACGIAKALKEGLELHLEIVNTELCRHPFIVNSLISMYVKLGLLLQAREVLNQASSCDTIAWTTLISGYADYGPYEEALECFEQMWSQGVFLDPVSFACSLKACGSLNATSKGRELHMDVVKRGYGMDFVVGNTLLSMYAKCGLLLEAQEVFNNLLIVDRVSWNALIAGFVAYGPAEEALVCFDIMPLKGISPDAATFTCALKACSNMGSLGRVQALHSDITTMGLETDATMSNVLVSVYAIHGSLLDAEYVFDKLQVQDLSSWSALIAGYAEHGPEEEALYCLDELQRIGMSPDAATYASALKACSSMGAMDRGFELHTEIAEKGYETDRAISSSLVSMYAKCGSIIT